MALVRPADCERSNREGGDPSRHKSLKACSLADEERRIASSCDRPLESPSEGIRMVRSLIRNQMPRKGLRVRVPCPPLWQIACDRPEKHQPLGRGRIHPTTHLALQSPKEKR